jgi:hypothetical protein
MQLVDDLPTTVSGRPVLLITDPVIEPAQLHDVFTGTCATSLLAANFADVTICLISFMPILHVS